MSNALKRAIKIISTHAKERFDACCSADGAGFVCGPVTCSDNLRCEREHAAMVRSAKELRAMLPKRSTTTRRAKDK
jgi:hypothetical protein